MKLNIEYINGDLISEKVKELIYRAFVEALELEDLDIDASVTISFITPDEIKDLNKTYRNVDKETDVLSFPIYSNVEEIDENNQYELELGDIFLNIDRAKRQAEDYGNTLDYEVVYLIIHSFLHLLGYDHMIDSDKKEMRDREKEIIRIIELKNVK